MSTERDQPCAARQLCNYIEKINDANFIADNVPLSQLIEQFAALKPLFERLFCVPATSAPVERIFSHSGLIMRAHRARMSDAVLETLVFLKCNSGLSTAE
jgi:hypothetical protein